MTSVIIAFILAWAFMAVSAMFSNQIKSHLYK